MRVWVVDPLSYSGMAYYDYGLVTALGSLGTEVTLVGSDRWLLDGHFEPERHLRAYRGTSGGSSRWRRAVAYLLSQQRLVRAVIHGRPQIVHWQYLEVPTIDLLAMWVMRLLGAKIVYTAHEVAPWRSWWLTEFLMRLVYRTADRVVVHNQDDATELARKHRVPAERICVIPHGDYKDFATPSLHQTVARRRLQLSAGVPIALFFGSMRPTKGLETLLAAWPLVRAHLPNARLLIAGRPQRDSPRMDFGGPAAGIHARLELIGLDEANDFYRAADLVVLPYDEITTSGVLRYAYSSARSVLATAVGEHRRWVVPGVTGELVPPGRPDRLASELVRLLSNRRRLRDMGQQALRFSSRHFSWTPIARSTIRCYEGIAPGLRRRGSP